MSSSPHPQETAQGDHGVYDVDSESITLIGSVVLTRDKNVIRGARLVLNLVTGESRIEGAPAGGAQGRVRGRFVSGPETKQVNGANGERVTPNFSTIC